MTSCGKSLDYWYYDNLRSGLLTVTSRQSDTPGPGHCSNRRQLNSSRKGRQDSRPRVQTVQAGRGPGGWTRHGRRAAGPGLPQPAGVTWPVRPAAPGMAYRTRYRHNLWYRRENFDILISRHCTDIMYDIQVFTKFYLRSPYIPILRYDIIPDIESKLRYCIYIYISSVQRGSKLNIIPDIEGFSSISKQYRMYTEGLFGASSESLLYPI